MNRTVLITGCSSGFGRAMVPAFARRGWHVIAGIRGGVAQDLDAEIVDLDITDAGRRESVVASLSRLDCLVNNAGYGLVGPFEEYSEAEIRQQLETNVIGTMLLTQACLPLLRAARGRIVVMSSMFGFTGFPLMSMYSASKFALEGWSEALHRELRPHGVGVALVEPGGYKTRFGENVRWPAAALPVYAPQRDALRRFRERLASRRRDAAAGDVAERVAEIASSRSMPFRVRAGRDARLLWMLGRLWPGLSGRIFDKALGVRP